jgi:hypothetical protein
LSDEIDREVAANAASNRHDFLVALEHAIKEQRVERQVEAEKSAAPAARVEGLRLAEG